MYLCVLGTLVSIAQTDKRIEMPFGGGQICASIRNRGVVLDGMHIVANWRIRLNDQCAAALRQTASWRLFSAARTRRK